MVDDERWVADNGAEELFFGDLFEVGEAQFREKFLGAKFSIPTPRVRIKGSTL